MKTTTSIQPRTKQCPFCAETIQAHAIKCRFCGEFLNGDKAKASETGSQPSSQSIRDQRQLDKVLFRGRPSMWAITGAVVKGLIFLGIAGFLVVFPLESHVQELLGIELSGKNALLFANCRQAVGIALACIVVLGLLIKTIRLKCIYYEVTGDRIERRRGILDRKVDNLDMFRVIDLRLRRNLLDCVLGIGTVELMTTDKTDPEFAFEKIHNCRRLYDIIKKASLEADRRNTVVHLE